MDPLSISASVLTVLSAAIVAIKALNGTVDRYKGRDKTLRRLQDGLADLINTLKSIEGVAQDESPVLALLKGPISRCAQVSKDFEDAMKTFSGKSKTGLMDWARMEFLKGDINEFIETLAGYKSTITIGLGIITMHTSTVTRQVVDEYNEVVKDTAYNLELRLQRIDQKMTSIAASQLGHPEDNGIDLQNERAVTLQCLRICESANFYIKSLQDAQPTLQKERTRQNAELIREQFEAQLVTQRTLNENRDSLAIAIGRLTTRLETLPHENSTDHEKDLLQLQKEMDYSKQCLEVCKEASNQVSSSKIHIIGEVIAETDCDQVVVTALADLFDVGIVKAKERSMQLVGSMPADTLLQMSKDRYGSRFGLVEGKLVPALSDVVEVTTSNSELQKGDQSVRRSKQAREAHLETSRDKPSPNEIRKRKTGQDGGER